MPTRHLIFRAQISLRAGPQLPDDREVPLIRVSSRWGLACDFGRPVRGAVSRVHEGSRHAMILRQGHGRMRVKTTEPVTAA